MEMLFRNVKKHNAPASGKKKKNHKKKAEMSVKLLLLENKRLERVWVEVAEVCCFLE